MQTTILQVLALVAHGNAALAGARVGDFYPRHIVFRFDNAVLFLDLEALEGGGWKPSAYAEDPNAWFEKLKAEKCQGLRAHWFASSQDDASPNSPHDWETVSFVGGGGRWLIEAVYDDGSDFWEGRSDQGGEGNMERKIWRVTYGRIAKRRKTMSDSTKTMAQVTGALKSILEEASAFAKRSGYLIYAGSFDQALSLLETEVPETRFDVAMQGQLPLEARRILAAAETAWVFGGMGSWNDLGDGSPEYEAISERLFKTLSSSLSAAVNLSYLS